MKSMIPSITCIALSIGTVTSALAQGPDMGSYWPSEDGRSWRYDQHFEEFAPVPDVLDNQVRLFFDGTTVAPNGIDAQVLREALVGGAASRAALAAAIPDPLLRSIWVARPDLRAHPAIDRDGAVPDWRGRLAVDPAGRRTRVPQDRR